MLASTSAETVGGRRRAGLDLVVIHVALQVQGEGARRFIAATAVLFESLHHDPVELSANGPAEPGRLSAATRGNGGQRFDRAELRTGFGRILLADDAEH